jgi:hypothetical protein
MDRTDHRSRAHCVAHVPNVQEGPKVRKMFILLEILGIWLVLGVVTQAFLHTFLFKRGYS